ncbi:unnamed protein product [Schistosoma turkestanicum]|nr:unnamed protein product [Schistosoma turkestanicum]
MTKTSLDTVKTNKASTLPQVRLEKVAKCSSSAHPNEFRPQTAICGHQCENFSRYHTVSSNTSSLEQNRSHFKEYDFFKPDTNENKPKESERSLVTKFRARIDFKQPALLPKPTKSELNKDPLINFMVPRGFRGGTQSSQYAYNTNEHLLTQKSENLSSENLKTGNHQSGYSLPNNQVCNDKSSQKNTVNKTSAGKHLNTNSLMEASDRNTNHATMKLTNTSKLYSSLMVRRKDGIGDNTEIPSAFNKPNKVSESIVSKRGTTSNTAQSVTEPATHNPVRHYSHNVNEKSSNTARPTGITESTTTNSVSLSSPSTIPSSLQLSSNNQPESDPPKLKNKLSPGKNGTYSKVTNNALSHKKLEEKNQNSNDKKEGEIFTAIKTIQHKSVVNTEESDPALYNSKFNFTNTTATTQLPPKGSELPGNKSPKRMNTLPIGINESTRMTVTDINSADVSKHKLTGPSENTAVSQFHTEKTYSSESKPLHKPNEKKDNLPYHKRQVNYSILDSVMGEMEQLFAGKQTNTPSKLSRIHSFAREKAMQCREENSDNEDNPTNASKLLKPPDVNDVNKTLTPHDLDSCKDMKTSSSVPQHKNGRQSERFQAALQAVEKNFRPIPVTEDVKSPKPSKVDGDIIGNHIKNVCPSIEKCSADLCNVSWLFNLKMTSDLVT